MTQTSWISRYRTFKPFSDEEAWLVFKIAALAEAVGWTLLIAGILIQKYLTPHTDIPVMIAGQIHGTIFLAYIAVVLAAAPSMNWSIRRTCVAGVASIPPYGSLIFELWAAHRRKNDSFRQLYLSVIPKRLMSKF